MPWTLYQAVKCQSGNLNLATLPRQPFPPTLSPPCNTYTHSLTDNKAPLGCPCCLTLSLFVKVCGSQEPGCVTWLSSRFIYILNTQHYPALHEHLPEQRSACPSTTSEPAGMETGHFSMEDTALLFLGDMGSRARAHSTLNKINSSFAVIETHTHCSLLWSLTGIRTCTDYTTDLLNMSNNAKVIGVYHC